MDDIDWHILDELQGAASLSLAQLADTVHVSAPTCQRRVQKLHRMGLIDRTVVIVNSEKLATLQGQGLMGVMEVSLETQSQQSLDVFARHAVSLDAVQQCYRVSPGPDFVLMLYLADMGAFQALAQSLLRADLQVRNVKTYFVTQREKVVSRIPVRRRKPSINVDPA